MHGQLTGETAVDVPANVVWDVYRGLELAKLAEQLLPDVIAKVQVIEGDGGVGTILKITFPPGTPGVGYMKEKFIKIDDEKRVKETETTEGGFKELGFDLYRVRLEIVEKDAKSTIVKSTIEYEANDKLASVASQVTTKPLETIAQVIGQYLSQKKDIVKANP